MKYLVVTGGVVSGLGKGISISSIGVLLKASGLNITAVKIDPYLNSDAGTMSPFEHGEVFVLNDGGEADLDLGNYERFLDITLTRDHNITTGKVYSQVIQAERRGDYLGKTVQVIPHVTDAIQNWLDRVSHQAVDSRAGGTPPDICLVEVGGTVGDIESLVFLEALRQLQFRVGAENFCLVHVSLVPMLGSVGEQKTKPTQHTVKELRSVGLNPDIILCRSATPLASGSREKLAMFCQVPPEQVLTVHDVPNIYHVPLLLEAQGATRIIAKKLRLALPAGTPSLGPWRSLAAAVDAAEAEVKIALVGKYTFLQDSYLSVIKSLQHAAIAAGRRLLVDWVDATALEPATEHSDGEAYRVSWELVRGAHGVLVPGGFGDRGVEGKIAAIRYAREHGVPFLGICLGMQCLVIEFARNVLGWAGANSAEFNADTQHPVIVFMPEINTSQMGGTMRLGSRATYLKPRADGKFTLAQELYGRGNKYVWERHRHRYEVNPESVPALTAAGLVIAGTDERNSRMEIIELPRPEAGEAAAAAAAAPAAGGGGGAKPTHPFFLGCQYHPEFQSHPHRPSPPFLGFVLAASGQGGAISARAEKAAAAGAAGLASPPRDPVGAAAPAGASTPHNTSVSSIPSSSVPSPTRPVRTVGVATVPSLGEVRDIAPGEGARGGAGGGVPLVPRRKTTEVFSSDGSNGE